MRRTFSLSELRRSLGLTQADVAERLKVGQDVVSRMERGEGLRVANLRRYLNALGATCEIQVRVRGRKPLYVREGTEEKLQ